MEIDSTFREELEQRSVAAGFCAVGIAPAQVEDAHRLRLAQWLSADMHGEMGYMARPNIDRSNAETVLPGAKSVIVFAASYAPPGPPPRPEIATGFVRIARYALGKDYHEVFRERLAQVETWLRETIPGHEWRIITDSAPLLERSFAEAAGLGFIGRNTMLITPTVGSFVHHRLPHSGHHCRGRGGRPVMYFVHDH
jgi:epoxyqueuosine reductase